MNRRKREIIVISILSVFIAICGFYLLFLHRNKETNEIEFNETSPIEKAEVNIDESKKLDPKYITLNNIDYSKLDETNWVVKYEDDEYSSMCGIDVSEYNGVVDFYTLKNEGIDFVMLRVGWRGYTEGGIYKDKYFEDYYSEAKKAGLQIGFYFFSQAINEKEAIEEANFVLDNIKDKECDLFVVHDMESVGGAGSRIFSLTLNERTRFARTFIDTIKEAGYEPMLYTNHDWATRYYNMDEFSDIPIWYAQYDDYPNLHFDYVMWQYTAKASVKGSSLVNHTDLNIMLKKSTNSASY